ncbi:MAG: hypothetical protein P4N60_09855 [Verrucomicrobiae bacterium]|nr:hypothetical protein [Verrucomicrobiae bacterium]
MWTCPKCHERIEDQFDSCWQCAGTAQPSTPAQDLAWLYPVISFAAWLGLGSYIGLFWHSPHHAGGYFGLGGAVLGTIVSAICLWAFWSCPWHRWFAKLLTLLFMVPALSYGILTVGSFYMHLLGYDVD